MNLGGSNADPLSLGLVLGLLSLAPLAFVAATSFAKLTVVFSVLRSGLGVPQVPSGLVITALAGMLSLYVMAPVGEAMWRAAAPKLAHGMTFETAWEAAHEAKAPLAAFLGRNAKASEKALFVDLARRSRPDAEVSDTDLFVVLPAFVITELTEAFQIGVLVLLPFLILELVVANALATLGMTTLSSASVSLPFKLLLFVVIDGWHVLAKALIAGYR